MRFLYSNSLFRVYSCPFGSVMESVEFASLFDCEWRLDSQSGLYLVYWRH
jgi:hypothetical protein